MNCSTVPRRRYDRKVQALFSEDIQLISGNDKFTAETWAHRIISIDCSYAAGEYLRRLYRTEIRSLPGRCGKLGLPFWHQTTDDQGAPSAVRRIIGTHKSNGRDSLTLSLKRAPVRRIRVGVPIAPHAIPNEQYRERDNRLDAVRSREGIHRAGWYRSGDRHDGKPTRLRA